VSKNILETSSRREFVHGCLAAVGAATLNGLGSGCSRSASAASSSFAVVSAAGTADEAINQSASAPRYLELERSGELRRRDRQLWSMLGDCTLCPRECGENRIRGRAGKCGVADTFKIASFGPHFGEEAPLVGSRGSGTIFFSNCNLLCVFCQNWQINHRGDGRVTTHAELAGMMMALQRSGCHNINLVTPTHLVPHIVRALRIAIADGLRLPVLYNSSGYESLVVLRLLDGVIDVYLPDFKYQDSQLAARFSDGAPDYQTHAAAAIKEMHRQVGTLRVTNGIAQRGLLIRHLVLPENTAGTDGFVKWVAAELGTDTHVNIMGQYSPQYHANQYPQLSRRPTREEIAQAMQWAREAGLQNFH